MSAQIPPGGPRQGQRSFVLRSTQNCISTSGRGHRSAGAPELAFGSLHSIFVSRFKIIKEYLFRQCLVKLLKAWGLQTSQFGNRKPGQLCMPPWASALTMRGSISSSHPPALHVSRSRNQPLLSPAPPACGIPFYKSHYCLSWLSASSKVSF